MGWGSRWLSWTSQAGNEILTTVIAEPAAIRESLHDSKLYL